MMLIDPFRFAGSNPAELEFLGAQVYPMLTGSSAIWSVSNVDIGTPRADRRIFLVLHLYYRPGIDPVVGGSINGHPVIIHAQAVNVAYPAASPPVEYVRSVILSAAVPTGSLGDVEIQFSPVARGNPWMAIYRATNMRDDTARDTESLVANGQFSYPVTLDAAKDGFVVAGAGFLGADITNSYIQGVENDYVFDPGNNWIRIFGGSDLTPADNPAYALNCVVERSHPTIGVFVAASFR